MMRSRLGSLFYVSVSMYSFRFAGGVIVLVAGGLIYKNDTMTGLLEQRECSSWMCSAHFSIKLRFQIDFRTAQSGF